MQANREFALTAISGCNLIMLCSEVKRIVLNSRTDD